MSRPSVVLLEEERSALLKVWFTFPAVLEYLREAIQTPLELDVLHCSADVLYLLEALAAPLQAQGLQHDSSKICYAILTGARNHFLELAELNVPSVQSILIDELGRERTPNRAAFIAVTQEIDISFNVVGVRKS